MPSRPFSHLAAPLRMVAALALPAAFALACAPGARGTSADGGGGDGGNGGGAGGNGGTGGGSPGDGPAADGKRGCSGGATVGLGTSEQPWRNPVVTCQWTVTGRDSSGTPLVIDVDKDGEPDIVFVSVDTHVDSGGNDHPNVQAIRGKDCKELWKSAELQAHGELGAADLDGDGYPEIVTLIFDGEGGHLQVIDHTGKLTARGPDMLEARTWGGYGGPAFANIDGDGPPEIIMGASVHRLATAGDKLELVWKKSFPMLGPPTYDYDTGHWGTLASAADLDGDGIMEVVTGKQIFDGLTGADKTPAAMKGLQGGYFAIAQMDPSTPEPEIILQTSLVDRGSIRFLDAKTGATIFGPYDMLVPDDPMIPGQKAGVGGGGGPAVADFDGDGHLEAAVAGPVDYTVYDMDCAKDPLPAGCAAPGILWRKKIKDISSGGASSSVFDFNHDGKVEVVYRDECWLRIYEGATGKVIAAYTVTSGTTLEEPVIADVDGDCSADIVLQSSAGGIGGRCPDDPEAETGAPFTGTTQGVLVMTDPMRRWAPVRKIWNENTYHVTNINADGSVPKHEANSWESGGGYRVNTAP